MNGVCGDCSLLRSSISTLDDRLHANKIAANNRALLISAILVALSSKSFASSYQQIAESRLLAKRIVETAAKQIHTLGVADQEVDLLRNQFNFLETEHFLLGDCEEFKALIQATEDALFGFAKTCPNVDVMGELYIECLRRGNQNKSLGIVLTPPHIVDLLTGLTKVDQSSVVYDNCAGTGGLLVGAARAANRKDQGTVDETKFSLNRFYGVELQPNVYALAVANMIFGQGSRLFVTQGDCFDRKITKTAYNRKPTVGLLNPPYRSDKVSDVHELEFVLNNLKCLQPGGVCAAVVPMQCAISTAQDNLRLRRELMTDHTLEAVLSMPDDLFFNSQANAVTCIMVFTAHKPHPPDKQVFLGYYKDDGFVRKRVGGRIDYHNKWETTKTIWLSQYRYRVSTPGLSVNVVLRPEDEWCAECYMDTDYSRMNDSLFENTLRDYSLYLFANGFRPSISESPQHTHNVKLSERQFKVFGLVDLFNVEGTKTIRPDYFKQAESDSNGGYPYVRTQQTNNGVQGFYDTHTEQGGVLVVESAVTGFCSYQSMPFSASDHIEKLVPRFDMNVCSALFLVTLLNLEQPRYNYGRKCSQSRLKRSLIRLPCDNAEQPDWEWITAYMRARRYSANLEP